MMRNEYCSLNSVELDEPIFATASWFTRLLLVEYNAPWSENALTDNKLPENVNEYLQHFKKASRLNRVFFIRNKQHADGSINIFAVHILPQMPHCNHFKLSAYEQLLNFPVTDLFAVNAAHTFHELMYLVCTNGKKDKCCSKFGLPVFKELLRLHRNVWECTHVGGDRFAPNVLALPYGIYYGALKPGDLPALVALTNGQKIFLKNYRGRCCHTMIEQAAEYFLRTQQNDDQILDHELSNGRETSPEHFEFTFRHTRTGAITTVKVKRGKAASKRRLTCTSAKEEYPPTYELIGS